MQKSSAFLDVFLSITYSQQNVWTDVDQIWQEIECSVRINIFIFKLFFEHSLANWLTDSINLSEIHYQFEYLLIKLTMIDMSI